MHPEPYQLVQRSWAVAAERGDELASCFYARLFAIDPAAARLFATVDMAAQRDKFVGMLAWLARVIDEPDALVPAAAALARRHAAYGVAATHYRSAGEALLWALNQALGDSYTPAVHAAWAEAYALLSSIMRRADVPGPRPPAREPEVG